MMQMSALDPLFDMLMATVGVLVALSIVFAALTVRLRVLNDRKSERWTRLEATWEPLILEALTAPDSAEQLHEAVSEGDRILFLAFLLRYHRRVEGEEREVISELARPYLPLLLPKLSDRSAETRGRALQTLAELGLPEYLGSLLHALGDDSLVVEMIAARSICRRGVVQGFPEVLARLSHFSLWSRQFLASMLVMIGPDAAPLLGEVVRDRARTVRDRAVCLDALRALHDLSAVQLASGILSDESDTELFASALRCMEDLGFESHAPLVRPHVHAVDQVVRAAAVSALGALGSDEDRTLLLACMEDESSWVALEAARGLSALGGRNALLQIAAGDDDEATLARQVLAEAEPR